MNNKKIFFEREIEEEFKREVYRPFCFATQIEKVEQGPFEVDQILSFQCGCSIGQEQEYNNKHSFCCKYCNENFLHFPILVRPNANSSYPSSLTPTPVVYYRAKREGEGLDVFIGTLAIEIDNTSCDENSFKQVELKAYISYECGEAPHFYMLTKNEKGYVGEEGQDPLFYLSSNSSSLAIYSSYENTKSFWEFKRENKKIFNMLGFNNVFPFINKIQKDRNPSCFLLTHLITLCYYPCLAQLIKVGRSLLYFEIAKDIAQRNIYTSPFSPQETHSRSQVINSNATKDSEAINLPSYIANYLFSYNATLREFSFWYDIENIKHISKEEFDLLIDSEEYQRFKFEYQSGEDEEEDNVSTLVKGIIKHGCTYYEVCKYVTQKGDSAEAWRFIKLWHDYLEICDLLEIETNKFPQNIKEEYDRVVEMQREIEEGRVINNYVDELLNSIKDIKLPEGYSVVIPRTIEEIEREIIGQYSYVINPTLIEKGLSIIFFIRKNNESYITAEYKRGRMCLGQVMYQNNQRVPSNHKDMRLVREIGEELALTLHQYFS